MSKRPSNEENENKAKSPKFDTTSEDSNSIKSNIFDGFRIHIFPTGIGKIRHNLFCKQVSVLGAVLEDKVSPHTTHIIVDESVSLNKICRILNWKDPPCNTKIVKTLWISRCIKLGSMLPTEDFDINRGQYTSSECVSCQSEPSPPKVTSSTTDTSQVSAVYSDKAAFVCSLPSQQRINHNKYITDKLELLLDTYKSTGDQWRTFGYEKAIIALKNHPKEITSWEEAKSIKGVGERLADKIAEIIQSGHLRKIDEICYEKRNAAIALFTKVWGIGSSTAQALVQKGFNSLDDLKSKAKLTKAQQIGLKYFEELQERMPRNEATEIFNVVEKKVKAFYPGALLVACGSHRRNRETCGDLDILITDATGSLPSNFLPNIVRILHDIGLLTDHLVSEEENGAHKKYMGICKLPGDDEKHRRIDIIAVPHDEYACALMHFTGSAHFNRSIRLLAATKNMSLSEHNLRAGVIRQGREKTTDGYILPTPTEESIFAHLGLEYRPPHERDHFAVE